MLGRAFFVVTVVSGLAFVVVNMVSGCIFFVANVLSVVFFLFTISCMRVALVNGVSSVATGAFAVVGSVLRSTDVFDGCTEATRVMFGARRRRGCTTIVTGCRATLCRFSSSAAVAINDRATIKVSEKVRYI